MVYHIAGVHEWPGFQSFSVYEHGEFRSEQRGNKVWLPVGSPAHNALKEVAVKPKLLKDVCRLTDFIQTCGLCVPKSQHSSYNGMKSRTQLAIIDHNSNARRGVATTMAGEQRYKCVLKKLQKQWVAKPVYAAKSYQFVQDLLCDPVSLKQGDLNVPPLTTPALPQNSVPTSLGSQEDIIACHVSRFQ